LTYYNVSFTSTTANSTAAITGGSNTFNNLSQTTPASGRRILSVSTSQTVNGTLTLGTTNTYNQRVQLVCSNTGVPATLTVATIATLSDVDFRDITAAGASGTWSGTRLGNGLGNSNITFAAGKTVYWNLVAGGNWSANAWATSSGGAVSTANFPLAQDTAIIDDTGLTTGNTITIDAGWYIGTLNCTRTNAWTLASAGGPTIFGDFTVPSVTTHTGAGTYGFQGQGLTQTITTNGTAFTQAFVMNTVNGTFLLVGALTLGTTNTFTLNNGTLNLSSYTLTCGLFGSSGASARTIAFGTGNIACTGTGAVYNGATQTNLTVTGTPIVNVTSTGSTAISVNAGSATVTESNSISFNFTGGTYPLSFNAFAARSLDFTGYAGTFSLNSAGVIYGNLKLSTGMTLNASSLALTFAATSGTQTITSNGKTMDFPITVDGVGGTWQLQDALTIGSTRTVLFYNGTLNLNNQTLSAGLFQSGGPAVRTLAFGTGNITVTGTGLVFTAGATGYTVTGTPVVNVTSTGSTPITVGSGVMSESQAFSFNFTGGTYPLTFLYLTGYTVKNVDFTGFAGTLSAITGNTIYGNLKLSTGMTLTAGSSILTFGATSGTQTITSNTKTMDFPITVDGVGGTVTCADALTMGSTRTLTLTNGTLDLNNLGLSTGLFNSNNSNVRSLITGYGGFISLTGNAATLWQTNTATNLTYPSGVPTVYASYSGTTGTRGFNTGGFADRINLNITAGTDTVAPTTTFLVNNYNFTGFAGTLTNVATYIYGSLTLSTGMTVSAGTSAFTFAATSGTSTITSNSKTMDFPVTFNGVGGTWSCADALTMGSTRTLTLTNGTLDLNGKTLTVGSAFTTAAGTKNLTFNGGTLACPSTSITAFNNAAPTGFTTTAGTGTGSISMTSASAKTFVGGGSTYNCSLNQGGAGALTITGANTFNDITNSYKATGATSILFTAGTTNTFSNWNASGTAGNLLTINSVTAATHTLSKASGIVNVDYLSVTNSTATGGASWYAGANSTNVSGNTGWIFSAAPAGAVLAGVLAAALLGTPVPSADFALSGVSSSAAVGTVTPAFSYAAALSGVSAAGSVGTLTTAFSYSVALTSVSASGLTGTATPKSTLALSGVLASGSTGTVTTAFSYSAALSGVSSSGSVGTTVPSAVFALTGVAVQGQAGRFVFPLGSNQASGFAGTIATDRVVTLAGIGLAAAVNSVSRGNTSFAISGAYASGYSGNTIAVYWKLIDDTQTANWQNIDNTQTPNWSAVTT
jgi:hypothetical protein